SHDQGAPSERHRTLPQVPIKWWPHRNADSKSACHDIGLDKPRGGPNKNQCLSLIPARHTAARTSRCTIRVTCYVASACLSAFIHDTYFRCAVCGRRRQVTFQG